MLFRCYPLNQTKLDLKVSHIQNSISKSTKSLA